jgi:hypothetical protein
LAFASGIKIADINRSTRIPLFKVKRIMKGSFIKTLFFTVLLAASFNAFSQEICDIEKIKILKSAHGTYKDLVSFTVDGQPRKGIRYLVGTSGLNSYQIAYEIDKFMHNGTAKYVLPTYTVIESNERTYAIQETIEDAETKAGEEIPDDLKVLDLIIGITGRYSPGLDVIYKDDRIYAINNEVDFVGALPPGNYIKVMSIFRGNDWVTTLKPSKEIIDIIFDLDIDGLKKVVEPYIGSKDAYLKDIADRINYIKEVFWTLKVEPPKYIITDIKKIDEMGTESGASAKVSFNKDGVTSWGLMKPVRSLSISDITKKTPNLYNFQKASDKDYRNAEQAVYEFDKYLGTGFVPETYTYNSPKATYTIQQWLPEKEYGSWSVPDDLEAFDFITGNLDRLDDRNLFKSGGKFYAIDNELAFPSPVLSITKHIFKMRGLGRKPLEKLQVSDDMKEKINNIKTEELYPLLSPYLKNTVHIDEMAKRVNYLKAIVNGDELSAQKIMEGDGKAAMLGYLGETSIDNDNTVLNKFFSIAYEDAKKNDGLMSNTTISLLARKDVVAYMDMVAANNVNALVATNDIAILTKSLKDVVDTWIVTAKMREKITEFELKYEELRGVIKK